MTDQASEPTKQPEQRYYRKNCGGVFHFLSVSDNPPGDGWQPLPELDRLVELLPRIEALLPWLEKSQVIDEETRTYLARIISIRDDPPVAHPPQPDKPLTVEESDVDKWLPGDTLGPTGRKLAPAAEAKRCPKCDSPQPHLHPAVQFEGEVQECDHEFHKRVTPQNSAAEAKPEREPSGDEPPNRPGSYIEDLQDRLRAAERERAEARKLISIHEKSHVIDELEIEESKARIAALDELIRARCAEIKKEVVFPLDEFGRSYLD